MAALESVTFEGAPEGSNLAFPPHEIPDTCARYLQDSLLDDAGLIRSRGPIEATPGVVTFPDAAVGMLQTINPSNVHKVGVLHNPASPHFAVTSDDYTTYTDLPWPGTVSTAPYTIVDAKAALGGGALIGTLGGYGNNTNNLAHWRGAEKPDYTTGTLSVTRGTKAVTGVGTAWAANAQPGMFLFSLATETTSTNVLIGVVATVNSDTSITLEAPATWGVAAKAYTLTSVRQVLPHYRGRITSQAGSNVIIGSSTHFAANLGQGGTWHCFRASDNAYLGKVGSVSHDTTLFLSANTGAVLNVEEAIFIRGDVTYASVTAPLVGALNAVYAERQWYADGDTLRFTEPADFEALDLDPRAGNFIPITSTKIGAVSRPITAIAPAYNALLVAKENETFTLIGSSPSQFVLRKLQDDGALHTGSVQVYDGSVIFAGREGIYAFDGQKVENIVSDRLGAFYKTLVRTFDPSTYRMWSMVSRDHYFLFIESVTSTYNVTKGSAAVAPTRMTIAINLPARAVTFMTNMDIRGAMELPASTGRGVWFLVNTSAGARICAVSDVFDQNGLDVLTCVGNTAGPDWYMESKRYGMGDDLRKKLFKQLSLEYFVGGDDIVLDTVLGLNDPGSTSLTRFVKTLLTWDTTPAVATTWDSVPPLYMTWDSLGIPQFTVKRVKFLKRTQQLGFRVYGASTSTTHVKLGPWSIAFKLQRVGRI